MFCPRGNCVYDSFGLTGVHVCSFGKCIYPQEYQQGLLLEIERIEAIKNLNFSLVVKLIRMRMEVIF